MSPSDRPDHMPKLTVTQRRARLAALLKPNEAPDARRRKELAAVLGVSPSTVHRDLQALRAAAQPARRVNVDFYVPTPQMADRDLALLRILGHTHVLRANWIRDLLYPDRAQRTVNHRLEHLRAQGLLWHSRQRLAPQRQQTTEGGRLAPPPNQPALYGLTPAGLERLRETKTLPDRQLFTMHTRAARSAPPSPQRLANDLRVVSWCASILSAASQCVRLEGAFAQVDAVVSRRPGNEQAELRADALIALRFDRQAARQPDTPLPWIDDPNTQLCYRDMDTRLFALHIDANWDTRTIQRLASSYYGLSLNRDNRRWYQQVNPTPLILTTSPGRAREIASLWGQPWYNQELLIHDDPQRRRADNLALITTYAHVTDSHWGTLWGRYWKMSERGAMEKPPEKFLLDGLFTPQQWQTSTRKLSSGARA